MAEGRPHRNLVSCKLLHPNILGYLATNLWEGIFSLGPRACSIIFPAVLGGIGMRIISF